MSRIGKMPITVPPGVTVKIDGQKVNVKGPKGELNRSLPSDMILKLEGNVLTVARPSDSKEHRSMHGLTRSLLANMVEGVSKGFEKGLEISGVGFRAEKAGNNLVLRIGFSHTVEVTPLQGNSFVLEGTSKFKVTGANKETVGEQAAEIRAIRPPDAYKGKGLRYAGELVHLKPGKAGKVVGRK
jgi:large subunit ribosomal protein L6